MNDNFENIKTMLDHQNGLIVKDGDTNWKVRGLNLNDLNHLIDVIPKKTLLKFIEGFNDKDLEQVEDYIIDTTSESFVDIYNTVIACGLDAAGQEENIQYMREVVKIKIFKMVMAETLPKNDAEMETITEAVEELGVSDSKKLKTILKLFLQIIKTLAD